ncbi:type I-B CRISPR-associated protein Cas7/Cst2/DevR [Brevibacillus thermoruber]|jgi:CRISPR-associated protein Cst2|uniref:Type I-B CRISPR-associated protein Cas7/Cst2/DevR n=1 Tax=Brevibacillus thermoruber TaxID=33942 RepID=A0A9X3Z3U1_9BACL|nr:type I-B CRISPR-associated protein Cas7/Cst2/DevR [Brevibacillus thermoruber]MDA5109231.1 type I-B CRISPR-associated protein Cas7/Cst2/DevR [Brevibacillus thermoruber]
MAHVTGLLLIDAPASALNNVGTLQGERTDNIVAVKHIQTKGYKTLPYVSAQAFRYWLRTTLETNEDIEWKSAPIFREAKIAYTDSNPLIYWDDDLFGYMRAESKKTGAKKEDVRETETPTTTTITRVSPFRVSTLVAISPTRLVEDFGVMARQEGDPVPHQHQFYRTTLKGLLSLDLRSAGTFWVSERTGFRNLDDTRVKMAEEMGLEKETVDNVEAYRLPDHERAQRIASLLKGIAHLEGGAKQSLHYTDVTPSFLMFAITRGGNHLFHHVVHDRDGNPHIHLAALEEVIRVYSDQLLSPLFIGWPKGYMDDQREEVVTLLENLKAEQLLSDYVLDHPRRVVLDLAERFQNESNYGWLR